MWPVECYEQKRVDKENLQNARRKSAQWKICRRVDGTKCRQSFSTRRVGTRTTDVHRSYCRGNCEFLRQHDFCVGTCCLVRRLDTSEFHSRLTAFRSVSLYFF